MAVMRETDGSFAPSGERSGGLAARELVAMPAAGPAVHGKAAPVNRIEPGGRPQSDGSVSNLFQASASAGYSC
jgi:hypothetical protein